MKLFKYVDGKGVVEIEGQPWPGKDADGETCYENTHFKTEVEAWDNAENGVLAGISLAAQSVINSRQMLAASEHRAADSCVEYEDFRRFKRERNVKEKTLELVDPVEAKP